MGFTLQNIDESLPQVTHDLRVKQSDGSFANQRIRLRRLTPLIRSVVYQSFPDPQAPIESEDSQGKKLAKPFFNTEHPAYTKDLQAAITSRECATVAIVIGIDAGDPGRPGHVFTWDDLGPGDRNDRRVAYCRAAAGIVAESLLPEAIGEIIGKASGVAGDTKSDTETDDNTGDSDAEADDLVTRLGKSSAPTPKPPEETPNEQSAQAARS